MVISTETGSFAKFGTNEEIVKMLKEVGFEAYDYSMFGVSDNIFLDEDDYLQRARALRAYADSIGIQCNQAHAPFPTARKGDDEYNKATLPRIVRAIEISGALGARVCVVHPCNDYTAEQNAELYRYLLPFAEKANVIIAAENMFNWDREEDHTLPAACSSPADFKKHLDLIQSPYFTACLDIGHSEIMGNEVSAVRMIETLSPRLGALHIHDNDKRYDCHILPFTGRINYEEVITALAKNGYEGDVTFESSSNAGRFPRELMPSFAKLMLETGEYIRREIERRR